MTVEEFHVEDEDDDLSSNTLLIRELNTQLHAALDKSMAKQELITSLELENVSLREKLRTLERCNAQLDHIIYHRNSQLEHQYQIQQYHEYQIEELKGSRHREMEVIDGGAINTAIDPIPSALYSKVEI